MEEKKTQTPHYKRVKDICLDVYSRDAEIEKRLLHGRALLNTQKGEFMFAQNEPRGPRSKEVYRGVMSRLVCRPDGLYTLTFSCMDSDTKHLREVLISEVRDVVNAMNAHREAHKKERREEK